MKPPDFSGRRAVIDGTLLRPEDGAGKRPRPGAGEDEDEDDGGGVA
jgi:hypothetical protein